MQETPDPGSIDTESLDDYALMTYCQSNPLLLPMNVGLGLNLHQIQVHQSGLVLKSESGMNTMDQDILNDMKQKLTQTGDNANDDKSANDEHISNYIKFNKQSIKDIIPSLNLSKDSAMHGTFSDLELFIMENVKPVTSGDYKSEFVNKKREFILSSTPELVDVGTSLKKSKATFNYQPQNTDFSDINLKGLINILKNLIDTEFSLLFDHTNSPKFIPASQMSQIRHYLKSINTINDTIITDQLKDIIGDQIEEILALEWDLFIKSNNPLEWEQLIEVLEILINSTFISVDLLEYSAEFIENQLYTIFKSIITLGRFLHQLFSNKYPKEKINFHSIIAYFCSLIDYSLPVLIKHRISENIIGELEFNFSNIVCSAIQTNLELSNSLEILRLKSSSILLTIFEHYESQQDVIISELMDRLEELPILKSKTKQYRFQNGNESVQVVSILLIQFIQCEDHKFDVNEKYFNLIDQKAKTKSDKSIIQNFENDLTKSVNDYFVKIDKLCLLITNLIFKRLVNDFANVKRQLDLLINDFLTTLSHVEFSCCENLLSSILKMGLHLVMADTIHSNIQSYILELIGKIISKLLQFRANEFNDMIPINISSNNFEKIDKIYCDILSYLQTNTKPKTFNLLITKYIKLLKDLKPSDEEDVLNDLITMNLIKLYKYKFQIEKMPTISDQSETDISVAYQTIMLTQPIANNYQYLLNFTLNMLNNTSVKIRAAAIKSLSILIDNDPDLLVRLRNVIENKLTEHYSNVTDSILNLLIKYHNYNSKEIEKYYSMVISKTFGQSLQIKKKSIKLLMHIYRSSSNSSIMDKIFETLVLKLADPDHFIVEFVTEELLNLIFVSIGRRFHHETTSIVKIKLDLNSKLDVVISNMVYIFDTSNGSNWYQFEQFIIKTGKMIHKLPKGYFQYIKYTSMLYINRIVEKIIDINQLSDKLMENLMGVLCTFVSMDNKLIKQDQLVSLKPYIISNYENKISFYTLKIFNCSLNKNVDYESDFSESLRCLLVKNLTRFYPLELSESVQCIWKLSKHNETNLVILGSLTIKIIQLLLKYKASKSKDVKFRRILYLLGSIGKFCNFEKIRKMFLDAQIGLKKESIMLYILNQLIYFYQLNTSSKGLKVDCIKNILNICVSHPKTFKHPKILKILDDGFKGDDITIKAILISNITTFMENIEKISNVDFIEMKKSDEVKFEIDVYHGNSKNDEINSICSNLVSKYFDTILTYCLDDSYELSFNSTKFLQFSVNFGFAIPMVCFSTISALEIARSDYIKSMAVEMHKKLYGSFASLIESCYIPGFRKTIDYSIKLYPGMNVIKSSNYLRYFIKLIDSPAKISKFYQLIFKFIKQNISMIEFTKLETEEVLKMVHLSAFMVVNLESIEISKLDEVLAIIVFVEKLLLSQSPNIIQHYQLVFYESDDSDLQEWVKYMVMCKCLIMFHRLKVNLVQTYGISSSTIMKFQDGDQMVQKAVSKVEADLKLQIDDLDLINYNQTMGDIKEMFELLISTVE